MAQSSNYNQRKYISWWLRTADFRRVMKRGALVRTKAGSLANAVAVGAALAYLLLNMLTIWYFRSSIVYIAAVVAVAVLAYPLIVAVFTIIPLSILQLVWKRPRDAARVKAATKVFAGHAGVVIAVAGSYGKTTMKELLALVFASEKKVAYTEGNRNTLLSIAQFSRTLKGDEDFVIVEFGEGASGDVGRMTSMVQPDYAVITGLAPNHLDGYKDIDDIAHDFTTLAMFVGHENAYVNGDSDVLVEKLSQFAKQYSAQDCLGRRVKDEKLAVNQSDFTLADGEEQIHITSGLIGRHNITALAFVAAFAREHRISTGGVQTALAGSAPYEHRLEPRPFHGAWLIDDTYNGSIEGMKAGLNLLNELSTNGKKIYVTPGLVDQGDETERVHTELGKAIADAQPDELYIMKNSVAHIIEESAKAHGYRGRVKVVEEPLKFYQNLESIVAKSDIVMCQNDWPDYYN